MADETTTQTEEEVDLSTLSLAQKLNRKYLSDLDHATGHFNEAEDAETIRVGATNSREAYDAADDAGKERFWEHVTRISNLFETLIGIETGYGRDEVTHILSCDNCGRYVGLGRMMYSENLVAGAKAVQGHQMLLELWYPAVKGINNPPRDEWGLIVFPEDVGPMEVMSDLVGALGL
jgi:hypothetical protein